MRAAGSHVHERSCTRHYRFLPVSDARPTDDHAQFAADVRDGLSRTPKAIAPRHFYDDVGSRLFQRIMDLPEYYLSACEHEILAERAFEILARLGRRPVAVVDLGAGDGRKTRHLLTALRHHGAPCRYLPIDVSEAAVSGLTDALAAEMPELELEGLVGDYADGLRWLSVDERDEARLVLFLGSNIGNFDPHGARTFMQDLARCLRAGDHVLMGFDLCKSPEVLLPAYDDAAGVTAAFNMNLLARLNRELDADFRFERFRHHPIYNPRSRAMESYLLSLEGHTVPVAGLGVEFHFEAWEAIHTESSYKYTRTDIDGLARHAGFAPVAQFVDTRDYFIDALFRVTAAA